MVKEAYLGMDSLWGEVDSCEKIADGIYDVQTPSHGGIIFDVHSDFVKEELSDEAWDVAESHHGWLCFEEDTAWSVAMWEIIYNDYELDWEYGPYDADPGRYEQTLIEMLQAYYPDYATAHVDPRLRD